MVIKWGRNGHFLACSGYPECRNTKEFTRNADGSLTVVPTTRPSDQICPTCGSPMVIKRGRFGEFLACSRYPECKTTSPISLGVDCPKPDCGGYLTEKRSRARQGLLRLLELLEDQVRLRVVGSPAAAAVPEVRRQVRGAEGVARPARASAASTKAAATPPTPRAPRPTKRPRPRRPARVKPSPAEPRAAKSRSRRRPAWGRRSTIGNRSRAGPSRSRPSSARFHLPAGRRRTDCPR